MNYRWFLAGIIFLLLIIQVVVSNRISTSGLEINRLQEEIEYANEENRILNEKIASASSLLVLKGKAITQGFAKNSIPLYLSSDLPVAFDLR